MSNNEINEVSDILNVCHLKSNTPLMLDIISLYKDEDIKKAEENIENIGETIKVLKEMITSPTLITFTNPLSEINKF